MRMRSLFLASAAVVAVAAISPSRSLEAGTGDRPEFQFRRPVLNGMGVSSLAELQGKPLLVEFWGTR